MKLRSILLVLLVLAGGYWLTMHLMPVGTLAALLHGGSSATAPAGPIGSFEITEAHAAPSFDAEEQQNIGVYKRALPSVVNITSRSVAYDFFYRPMPQEGQGSGFIINKDGLILTNNHVIANAQQIEVTLSDKHKYKARLLTTDPGHDLALLHIDAPNLVPATLSDSTGLVVGQKVYAIGNPFGLSGTMTRGIISAIRQINGPNGYPIDNAIQTDASVNPGNSGGPLLNSRGDVIGVTTLIASNGADQSAGIGFAIPIDTAKAVLDDFSRYGRVRRPSLDIVTIPIGPDAADAIGLAADYGLLIERVLPGGAAEKAGLHGGNQKVYDGNTPVMLGGDLLVGLDGQQIASPQDLSAALVNHHPGDTVTVSVYRGRRRMEFRVTLDDTQETGAGRSI